MTSWVLITTVLLAFNLSGRPVENTDAVGASPLQTTIAHFDVEHAIFREAISELTLKNVEGLHIGFEEIIRQNIQDDPRQLGHEFSLHLQGKSVRDVLEALCNSDARYTWSQDAGSINIYPRATRSDHSYLFNLQIERIDLNDIPDPNQALTPLSKLFPDQQIGYFGAGLAEFSYDRPWSASFARLTVRQFINRVSEHMGPRTSWVWQGGQDERMFTFLKGGFHSGAGPG